MSSSVGVCDRAAAVFPIVAKCCGNVVPHRCRHQVDNNGKQCGGVCSKPSQVPSEDAAWLSLGNCNHLWYSCCCCGSLVFKNWPQYRKHRGRCPYRRRRSTSHTPSSTLKPLSSPGTKRGEKRLKVSGSAPGECDDDLILDLLDLDLPELPQNGGDITPACEQDSPQEQSMAPFNILPSKEVPEFHRKASTVYFDRDRNGDGPASLAARAMTKSGEENYKYLRKDDVELAMILTDLCSRMSRPQKKIFASFLARYSHKLTLDAQGKQGGDDYGSISLDVATDFAGLRRTIYESANSIYQNLPHPPVEVVDGHACVSLIACLEDLLAHGHDINTIPSLEACATGPRAPEGEDDAAEGSRDDMVAIPFRVTKLSESLAAGTILQNSRNRNDGAKITITTYGIEWKDDCEPNNIKQHQGGIFVSTFTFASPPPQRNSLNHTYVVAVGPQHVNHDCVERKIARELRILCGREPGVPAPRFYSKKHGGILTIHLELISSLADQPMRRFMNGLIAGNGTYGARFGMSIDLASVIDTVAPCDSCLARMLSGLPSVECQDCTNWDMSHDRIRMKAPANYPPEELLDGDDNTISPKVITYENLKAWVTKAHEKYVSESWGDKAMVAFLTSCALSTQSIKGIVQHAEGALVYKRYGRL